ncbi:Transmembrane protein 170A [Trichoplax sp. H2]|uniref:Transmembrane protein 170A n=1 Tax=Trichoplax adhaerens TaxID=10228 RepID=B3RIR5_TRIAD|nr:hypothetical protein TRIADDRAFT_52499 [Trichoplax adhaerens]EDV29768.1 hypothetical protein TRIADDRAFT_52499 [Trichoplax adhaerens]RDD47116.1 Transmembrane protein 170A [Trichoplax sp. H2]|eukprot:XP_002108970.1 hypothetical protein TRIADDRAFT_52499 [Trichoplax adhaerens]
MASESQLFFLSPNGTFLIEHFLPYWFNIFVWCVVTSVLIHVLAALVAFRALRYQRIGSYTACIFLLVSLIYPLTGGAIFSALIAGIFSTGGFVIESSYVILIGIGLTIAYVITSYSRVLASL